jgi:hypothetical protein
MLELLERIGTPAARQLLEKSAGDKSDPWLAEQARAVCQRLAR